MQGSWQKWSALVERWQAWIGQRHGLCLVLGCTGKNVAGVVEAQ